MTTLSDDAPSVLKAYYRILGAGMGTYDPAGEFRTLLADDLEFEGPLAGKRAGAEGFCQGVKGFIGSVTAISVIQEVHGLHGSAILYDARMPGGTVRFAEFFTISDGKITALRLHYDAAGYTQKGGR
ncbi:UNVERIFIED_ORG: ketosteroid isomerase-like protein [Arthrobacter globiformis]|nr:ketosteroid isomerase-like protein [Arthrobacter globiformis]